MILAFDLDDTLYDETTYVKSGFQAVALFLEQQFKIPHKKSLNFMLEYFLTYGRNKVFNAVLSHFSILTKQNIKKCIRYYHVHMPNIRLDPKAKQCLQRFSHIPKYIVTDGNKIVQKNKIIALNISKHMKFCFITHRYGIHYSKPSPYCLQKMCKMEKAKPSEIIFIGDNPTKDFVGIKPLGFKTIRILQGAHKFLKMDPEFEADTMIHSLDELTEPFLKKLMQ